MAVLFKPVHVKVHRTNSRKKNTNL